MADSKYGEAAHIALRAFSVSPKKVAFVSHSENISFRVDSQCGKTYVLRLHRPTYHNYTELVSEQLWTEALVEAGVDVPIAVPTTDGKRYTQVECPDGARFAGLLEWVEGDELGSVMERGENSGTITESYRLLGQLIAQLHNHAVEWAIPRGFSRHSFDSDGFVGEQPFWGRYWESPMLEQAQQASLSSIRAEIEKILCSYEQTQSNYSLIHADLHPHNVIVQGSRLHIIDFDDAGFGWHAYDLAVALHRMKDSSNYLDAKTSLLNGYSDLRSVNHSNTQMIEMFHVVRSLASIGWVTSRPELHRNTRSLCQHLYSDAVTGFERLSSQ